MRDKGTAGEIRRQLDNYLTSVDKAERAVYEWEMRVAEIGEEVQKSRESRREK